MNIFLMQNTGPQVRPATLVLLAGWNGGFIKLPSHLSSGQDLFREKRCNGVCSPAFFWVLSCLYLQEENHRDVEIEIILEI